MPKFNIHNQNVNAMAWAPQSSTHLCSVGDDGKCLIWDINDLKENLMDNLLEYNAREEISNISWSTL